MTSKNLYFKLMKEDLKSRIWAVSLLGLGFFFLYPVVVAFSAGDIKDYATYELGLKWYSDQMETWLSFENGMTVFVMMVTALICGLSGFSYLNSKSKVDFYHSIPVRREKLYIANYVNGILILAVPYAVSMVLAVFVGISNGVDGGMLWHTAFAAYWLHLTYFILMYTTVVIAVMMTGNLVVAFLGSLVFSFFVPLAVALAQGYFGVFFHTYVWESGEKLVTFGTRISPVMEYIYQLGRYSDGETVWTAAVLALVIAAALAVLGGFLYRKRPSEAAGRAMAFKAAKPVIRILMTLLSATGLASLFWSMRESTGWAVFGVLCGAVICHCVIEIIYHFDFKKLFADRLQLIGCIMVSLAVLFVFRYDLAGYDRYLPSAGEVEDVAVEVTRLNGWTSYGTSRQLSDGSFEWSSVDSMDYVTEHMKYTDVENVLAIAASGIDEAEKNGDNNTRNTQGAMPGDTIDAESGGTFSTLTICYRLKGGRRVYRGYTVNLDALMPRFDKLCASAEFQQGIFPVMSVKPEDVAGVYYSEMQKNIRLNQLTEEQKATILETYQREFAALTPERMKTEFPLGLIRFATGTDEAALQWADRTEDSDFGSSSRYQYSRGDFENRSYYPIYPSFTETIRLLKEQQVEAGSFYKNMDIKSVSINWDWPDEDGVYTNQAEVLITDPQEIEELKAIMVGPGGRYYNTMFSMSDVDVHISVSKNGGVQNYSAGFPRGKLPEFVTERLYEAKTK